MDIIICVFIFIIGLLGYIGFMIIDKTTEAVHKQQVEAARLHIDPVATFFQKDRTWRVKFSSNGRFIFCGGFDSIRIWDQLTNSELGISIPGKSFVFSPDGNTMAVIEEVNNIQSIASYSMQDFRKISSISSETWGSGWNLGSDLRKSGISPFHLITNNL